MTFKVDGKRIEAVCERWRTRCPGVEIRVHEPEGFGPVEFLIGDDQQVQIDWERFEDHDTAEEILPGVALHKARLGDSFRLDKAGEIHFL